MALMKAVLNEQRKTPMNAVPIHTIPVGRARKTFVIPTPRKCTPRQEHWNSSFASNQAWNNLFQRHNANPLLSSNSLYSNPGYRPQLFIRAIFPTEALEAQHDHRVFPSFSTLSRSRERKRAADRAHKELPPSAVDILVSVASKVILGPAPMIVYRR